MAADEASKLEAETQDEIEQIMSEIEELQQEMTETAAAAPAQAAPQKAQPAAVPSVTPSAVSDAMDDLESDRSMTEFVTVEGDDAPAAFPDAEASASEEEEPWVQETLAELNKPESRASSRVMPVASEAAADFTSAAVSGGRITLGVQGSLDVCLKHEGSGTELVIEFTGDSVHVIVSGGAEFKIPLQAVPRSLRRVA